MYVSLDGSPKWPARLKECSSELCCSRGELSRDNARGQAWQILNAAILLYLRFHSAQLGKASREDLEDLAAEKSLDLLRRIESGRVDFSNPSPAQITSFISKVARNGLLDLLRESGRWVEPREEDQSEWDIGGTTGEDPQSALEPPSLRLERREFAAALRMCAERLDRRSRLAWFFRVFYGMSSKDIAVHPEIGLRVSHVDVLLLRARRMIRACMHRRGYEPHDMPLGTFVELWKTWRVETNVTLGATP